MFYAATSSLTGRKVFSGCRLASDVHLPVDPVHRRDEGDGHESDDDTYEDDHRGSKRAVNCLSL